MKKILFTNYAKKKMDLGLFFLVILLSGEQVASGGVGQRLPLE